MLNDSERRALADLERHLQHDPEFVARMDGLATAPAVPAFPIVPVLSAGLFITVPLVMLLFGWVGVIILLYAFAIAIGVIVFRRL
ncbi:DUF3040 domain-containing protein [Actinoplanes regularis]|uniref:DUF3040 domain-containing protein n=1 Tax=Actinoplanes regularis TaxID=52697 RepID=UPI0024A30EC8|nr:DUF3040 domain-containing protein [Actinoplanes regularis]GLW31902.1 hypothetical protein Areg01_48410 [Actinoplanes regularis]